ncbi:MAG: histidine kinase [Oscillospiraceae bacterium]
MIEVIDNAMQLFVTTVCAFWAGTLAFKSKKQVYRILTCFYGTFSLGLLFWLMYLIVMTYTPKIFYVSDLSWVASFLFLFMLNVFVSTTEERKYKTPITWVVTAVLLALMVYFCFWGDYLNTILSSGILILNGYFSTRGFIYARHQNDEKRSMQYIHGAILFVVFAENALWLASCLYPDITIKTPYVWLDFVLSIGLFSLIPATKKVVGK